MVLRSHPSSRRLSRPLAVLGVLVGFAPIVACAILDGSETSSSAATAVTLEMSAETVVESGGGLAAGRGAITSVASAPDGETHLFVWAEAGGAIRMARVDAGRVVDVPARTLGSGASPSVAFDDERWVVAWVSGADVVRTEVARNGAFEAAVPIAAADARSRVAISANGSDVLAVWTGPCREDGCVGRRLYGLHHGEPTVLATIDAEGDVPLQLAARSGTWLAAWSLSGREKLFALPIGADGAPGAAVTLPAGEDPALAADGTSYLLSSSRGGKIRVLRLDDQGAAPAEAPEGVVIAETGLPRARAQTGVAFDGTEWVVAWTTFTGTNRPTAFAIRVSTSGAPIGERIAFGELGGEAGAPRLACSSGRCLLPLRAERGALGLRHVDGAGVVADAAPTLAFAASEQRQPAAASNGTSYFVAWSDDRLDRSDNDPRARIFGAAVDPEGRSLGPARALSEGDETDVSGPAVATDGTSYLAVYGSGKADCLTSIRARRVGADGAFLDDRSFLVAKASPSALGGCIGAPTAAFDGTDFVVGWTEERSAAFGHVFARRISPGGQLRPVAESARGGVSGAVRFVATRSGALALWGRCQRDGLDACKTTDIVASPFVDGAFAAAGGKLLSKDVGRAPFEVTIDETGVLAVTQAPHGNGSRAIRVSAGGEPAGEPFAVGRLPSALKLHDGRALLEVGTDGEELVAHSLAAGGDVAAARVVLGSLHDDAAVRRFVPASDGHGHTLVVYASATPGPRLVARRLTSRDAAAPDAGPDSATRDAAVEPTDAGPPPPDTGADAGVRPDAGTRPDASTPPVGRPDAGTRRDAAVDPDVDPLPDDSETPAAPSGEPERPRASAPKKQAVEDGCSVGAFGASSSSSRATPLAIVLVGLLARRRRRLRSHS